jgi:hypothetical protein
MDTAIIPKSSSCDSRDFEVKPKAACQSVQLDTCNDSDISVVGIYKMSVNRSPTVEWYSLLLLINDTSGHLCCFILSCNNVLQKYQKFLLQRYQSHYRYLVVQTGKQLSALLQNLENHRMMI